MMKMPSSPSPTVTYSASEARMISIEPPFAGSVSCAEMTEVAKKQKAGTYLDAKNRFRTHFTAQRADIPSNKVCFEALQRSFVEIKNLGLFQRRVRKLHMTGDECDTIPVRAQAAASVFDIA